MIFVGVIVFLQKWILKAIAKRTVNTQLRYRKNVITKLFIIRNNEDLLFLVRSGALFEELYLFVIALAFSVFRINFSRYIMVLLYLGVLTASYINLYYRLLAKDEGKKLFFYRECRYRLAKIKSLLVIPMFFAVPAILLM